ncbi:hypothetical protein [Streptomyces sp. NPDC000229]|uniref:hypothetical protein n=1 Tax=Streptomyces sp. NPDC000229 TaxID=3154247 RepID=UPI003321756D
MGAVVGRRQPVGAAMLGTAGPHAAGHLVDLHEGLWVTVAGRDEINTTCAVAGGWSALAGASPPSPCLARSP